MKAMSGPKILIIDDNEITRKLVRVALSVEGYDVVEAGDGRSAMLAVAEHLPDLILQDLILPDIGGIDLLKQLRAHPLTAYIPIIAMSGFQSEMVLAER